MPLAGATLVLVPAIGRYQRVWLFALGEGSGFDPLYLGLTTAWGKLSGIRWGPLNKPPASHEAEGSTRHQQPSLRTRIHVVAFRDRLGGGLDFECGLAIWRSVASTAKLHRDFDAR